MNTQTILVRKGYDAGEAIRSRRTERGLSQEELARLADISVRTVIRLEQATESRPADALASTLQAIGKVLGITFVLEPTPGRPGGEVNHG